MAEAHSQGCMEAGQGKAGRAEKPGLREPTGAQKRRVQELPERNRAVYRLRYASGLSYGEIATQLCIKDATARKRGQKAREALKDLARTELEHARLARSVWPAERRSAKRAKHAGSETAEIHAGQYATRCIWVRIPTP